MTPIEEWTALNSKSDVADTACAHCFVEERHHCLHGYSNIDWDQSSIALLPRGSPSSSAAARRPRTGKSVLPAPRRRPSSRQGLTHAVVEISDIISGTIYGYRGCVFCREGIVFRAAGRRPRTGKSAQYWNERHALRFLVECCYRSFLEVNRDTDQFREGLGILLPNKDW